MPSYQTSLIPIQNPDSQSNLNQRLKCSFIYPNENIYGHSYQLFSFWIATTLESLFIEIFQLLTDCPVTYPEQLFCSPTPVPCLCWRVLTIHNNSIWITTHLTALSQPALHFPNYFNLHSHFLMQLFKKIDGLIPQKYRLFN